MPCAPSVILTKTRTNAFGIELSSDQRRGGAGSMIAAASTFKSAFALLEATPRRCACLSPVGQGQPVGSARFASYVRSSSGTLPPFSTSFCITCLCSQIFIDAESFVLPP